MGLNSRGVFASPAMTFTAWTVTMTGGDVNRTNYKSQKEEKSSNILVSSRALQLALICLIGTGCASQSQYSVIPSHEAQPWFVTAETGDTHQ